MSQAEGESSHETFTASITADNSSKKSKKKKLNKGNEPRSMIIEDDEELFKEAMSVLRAPPSDEFDVFGNYVAVELRQLRSEERRRRLKRIIQRAIIDMGEEEDRCEKIGSTCSSGNYSDTVSDWASSSGFSNQNPHDNLLTLSNLSSIPQQLASDSSNLSTFYENYNPK